MRCGIRLIVVGALLLSSAAAAYAQGPNQTSRERPYRGLFGGGPVVNSQSLTFSGSLGGGYDSNVLASDAFNFGVAGTRAGVDSQVVSADGALAYELRRQRVSLFGSAMTSVQYFPALDNPTVQSHSFGSGGSWLLTPRTTLSGALSISFDPFYSLLPGVPNGIPLEPGAPEMPSPDTLATVQDEEHRSLRSNIQLTHSFSRRVYAQGHASSYQTRSDSREFDLTSQEVGAGVNWSITRNLGLRLGYSSAKATYAESDANPESSSRSNTIDAGIDYNRSLSLSRRTTLAVGTGFTGVSHDGDTSYSLVGRVSLTHEMGRTWTAATGYARDVQFIDVLRRPAFTDTVFGNVDGTLSSRLQASAGVAYQRGDPVGGGTSGESYHSGQGSASLSYEMTGNLATALEYSYFWYDFSQTVDASRFPEETNRHSVRVVLRAWVPVFQRPRRPNASR